MDRATERVPLDVPGTDSAPLIAAAAVAVFEPAFFAVMGFALSPSYVATCAALSLVAGALASQLDRVPLPAARGLGLAVFAGGNGALAAGWFGGATLLAASWLATRVARHPRNAPTAALAVALGLAASLVVWPRAADDLGWKARNAWLEEAAIGLLFAAVVLGVALLHRAAAPRRALVPLLAAGLVGGCLLPLLRGGSLSSGPPRFVAEAAGAGRPDLILLILDTVRADHLSIYGYSRETTPALAAFLERTPRARLHPAAYATGTWTLPSHASLFTGTLPSHHGVHAKSVFASGALAEVTLRAGSTLAEELGKTGYRSACIFANSWLRHVDGLERGFDWFVRPNGYAQLRLLGEGLARLALPGFFRSERGGALTADLVNGHVLRFLDVCGADPCFVVANYMEAHAPHVPPRSVAGMFSGERRPRAPAPTMRDSAEALRFMEAVYDEDIRALDAALGRLLAALERDGRLDRSWIVITSDHGEGFGEHGVTEHGTTVYSEVTRIPLLVVPPKGVELPPFEHSAGLLDVAATLAAVGGAGPFGLGVDLREPTGERPVPIEFFGDERKAEAHGPLAALPARSVLRGPFKLIEHDGRHELYRVDRDPEEMRDLAGSDPARVEALRGSLPPLEHREDGASRDLDLTPAEREHLRELGYIE